MVFTCRPLCYPCSGAVAGLSRFVGCRASYGTTVNRACSTLDGGDLSVPRHWTWPWVFEQPGKCADLPEEEVFVGFDGIDTFFDDEFFDLDDSPQNAVGVDHDASDALWSTAYSKVRLCSHLCLALNELWSSEGINPCASNREMCILDRTPSHSWTCCGAGFA